MNEFGPDPKTFGARIDSGSNFESIILIEEHSIEDIAFPRSVFSDYGDDCDVLFLIGLKEPIDSLLINIKLCMDGSLLLLESIEISWIGFM